MGIYGVEVKDLDSGDVGRALAASDYPLDTPEAIERFCEEQVVAIARQSGRPRIEVVQVVDLLDGLRTIYAK